MFIRLHKKLVVIDLSRQKELGPKAIKQIELVGQVKNDWYKCWQSKILCLF